MTFEHRIRIRYGECDMQRVVFNAHYFAYCDDAVDTWFRSVLSPSGGGGFEAIGFDFMLKKAHVVWHAPLVFGEVAVLACDVVRWGGSSFDVRIEGSGEPKDGAVPGEAPAPRFTALITYVSVVPHENRPTPVPAVVRDALSA